MISSKRLQYVLAFIVAGGAFVVLQGTAWAADDQTATTQSPAPGVTAATAPVGAAPVVPVVTATNDTVTAGPTDASPTQPQVAKDRDANKDTTGKNDEKPAVSPVVTEPVSKVTPEEPAQPVPASPAAAAVVTQLSSNSENTQPQAIIQVDYTHPAVLVMPATVLPIQPTIRNYAAAEAGDLAANIPSMPIAAKDPVPAKSNGALGKLRVMLAGVVVPQLFTPFGPTTIGVAGILALLAGLLLAGRYAFNYGLWLKRGGFVNAARSDSPVRATTSSLFATPQLLGYVTTPPRRHSPIFVVSDIKSSIYQFLFPMLSERRICI